MTLKSYLPEPSASPADIRELPLHDEIARHARHLWEKYGKPDDRDDEIWLEAEGQLLGADPEVRKVGEGTVSSPLFAKEATE